MIYQINCKEKNCKANYIGQTKRALSIRLDEHKKNINRHPKYHNVVTQHRLDFGHEMDWNKPRILDIETNWYRRLTSEMLHIKSNNCTLNAQTDTKKLSDIYKATIKYRN